MMVDNTLTLALEGDVSLTQFRETINHFANLVDLLSKEVAPEVHIDWFIEDLQGGSALATIAGFAETEEPVLRVVRSYETVGTQLKSGDRISFSQQVEREARSITQVVSGKIISVRFETAETDTVIYSALATKQRRTGEPRVSFGAVKGRVQALSNRSGLKFTLYDSLFDRPINCYLRPEQEAQMVQIWGKDVHVMGRVTRNLDTGQPVNVRDITHIESAITSQGESYRTARGIFAWEGSDELAEVTIRRLRDAQD